jgi:hypothetical protein
MLDPDVRRVLDGASFALATILPDGSPHTRAMRRGRSSTNWPSNTPAPLTRESKSASWP